MTAALELLFLAIVSAFIAGRGPRTTLPRLVLYAAAAWIAEDTVIHAYGFYEYSPAWSILVDKVPLTVLLIWPVVILSAQDLAGSDRAPLIVLTDAALIEPIAVLCGYWWWTEPGIFQVPPIGIAGWAIFAFWALRLESRGPLAVLLGAPALTHLTLLALWWGALRWVNALIPDTAALGAAVAVSAALTWRTLREPPPPRRILLLRIPAAAFFFAALALADPPPSWQLVGYAAAFAPPYLVATFKSATIRATSR